MVPRLCGSSTPSHQHHRKGCSPLISAAEQIGPARRTLDLGGAGGHPWWSGVPHIFCSLLPGTSL